MRHAFLEKIYLWLLVIVLVGVVVHAPLSVFVGTRIPELELAIKSWKELLLLLCLVVALWYITVQGLWKRLLNDWVIRLILAYTALHFILGLALFQGTEPFVAGMMIDLRYVLIFALIYSLLLAAPQYRRPLLTAIAIGGAIVVGFGILQLFLPHDFLRLLGYSSQTILPYMTVDQNYDFIRINSTLRGPNPLGAYVVIVISMIGAFLLRRKACSSKEVAGLWLGAMASVVVVWMSYARSALMAMGVAAGILLIMLLRRVMSFKIMAAIAIAAMVLGGTSLYLLRDNQFVSTVVMHEDPLEGGARNSNDEHWASLRDGTERMLAQPFGAGVGSTGSASLLGDKGLIIENQFLFIAHETGWLGLALFLILFGLILWRLWKRSDDWVALAALASGIGISLAGMVLPVWVDDTVGIVWWGLAAVALARPLPQKPAKQKGGAGAKTNQKTKAAA